MMKCVNKSSSLGIGPLYLYICSFYPSKTPVKPKEAKRETQFLKDFSSLINFFEGNHHGSRYVLS